MTVYLLHVFGTLRNHRPRGLRPRQRCSHYIGFTVYRRAERRVRQHRQGCSGSKYMRQVLREGLRFYLVREWIGAGRETERRLKNWKAADQLCPWCRRRRAPPSRRTA